MGQSVIGALSDNISRLFQHFPKVVTNELPAEDQRQAMDNPSFRGDSGLDENKTKTKADFNYANEKGDSHGQNGTIPSNGDANGSEESKNKKPKGPVKRTYKRTKSALKENKYTQPFCPPTGEVATTLTLILTIIAIFLAARAVLGPIADVGGTIFALLMLILVALIGGKLVLGFSWCLLRFFNVDIRLPPLLGMLIVGIILKNVPYNFGQFGRAECTADHHKAGFVDSIHELDGEDDKGSFRKRRDVFFEEELEQEKEFILDRIARSIDTHEPEPEPEGHEDSDCHPKYIGHDLDPYISRTLRSICLTVILLMAGLELDPHALMKLSAMVVRATFIPCFVEAIVVAILSNLLLGFPWTVGFMLGFVLAAVSPAVIIPCLMSLSQRGYGVEKGIPTLVIAACSADDVVAISGFGIFMGLTFSAGEPLWKLILHGPIEVVIGVAFGIFWGYLAQWIPNKDHHHVAFFRWLIMLAGGLIALFGAHLIHYDGAGGLATIIMAFVASIQWRKEGWGDHNPVSKTFKRMWIILEPVIFALIGTEIQVDKINPATLGLSILVLVLALVIRMIGTYFAVCGGELNRREKVFMAFAWMPKATVQAALGPIFLDRVKKVTEEQWLVLGDKQLWTEMGNDILTLAVLSILITAPLGAVSILGLGPKLLSTNQKKCENDSDAETCESSENL